jgi:hypothetical protein
MDVRIHDVVARMQVVDGDALLTPQLLARIVSAVSQAMAEAKADEHSRKRDTRIGGAGGCCDGCGESGEHGQ